MHCEIKRKQNPAGTPNVYRGLWPLVLEAQDSRSRARDTSFEKSSNTSMSMMQRNEILHCREALQFDSLRVY
jgi:hypothetical protein